MNAEPQKEHHWLQKFVGEWTFEGEASMGPDQPPMKSRGAETVRSIGSLWIQGEGNGEMPGGGMATMLLTLGFDPQKKRFVGTWVGTWEGAGSSGGIELILEKGKDANIVFVNGDPFQPTTRIQAVMQDGKFVHGEVNQ